ncbi:Uncharacterised protein [Escherichia coli]|nr:Uncharacterised protein [Escherichia coli]
MTGQTDLLKNTKETEIVVPQALAYVFWIARAAK